MFSVNILPGQGFHSFLVCHEKSGVTDSGRAITGGTIEKTDVAFYGMLMNASQKEIDQWKQKGHPISHKIIEYSAMQKAKATDYLVAPDGRQFYVQGVKNPADLNVTMVYYVEERLDVKKRDE